MDSCDTEVDLKGVANMPTKVHEERMAISPKNIHINVKVSREENELIKRVAAMEGRSASNYVRFVALRDAALKLKK